MLSLTVLIWLCFFAAFIAFWWHSDIVKGIALNHAKSQCKRQEVQFLDQSMVLKSLWPIRNQIGSLAFCRIYQFEFSSTGEQRYKGLVTITGRKLDSIEMEPHIMP
jgi:hypothetical protein